MNESFTGFVEMSSVSAESISAAILAHLSRIGVDLRKLVGQGYDGASNVGLPYFRCPKRGQVSSASKIQVG